MQIYFTPKQVKYFFLEFLHDTTTRTVEKNDSIIYHTADARRIRYIECKKVGIGRYVYVSSIGTLKPFGDLCKQVPMSSIWYNARFKCVIKIQLQK